MRLAKRNDSLPPHHSGPLLSQLPQPCIRPVGPRPEGLKDESKACQAVRHTGTKTFLQVRQISTTTAAAAAAATTTTSSNADKNMNNDL